MRPLKAPIFQRGQLHDTAGCGRHLRCLGPKLVLITDEPIAALHAESFCTGLRAEGLDIQMLILPSGEHTKSRESKAQLEDALFKAKLGRDGVLVAMGGGVIMDLVGFLASTYCRGVALVLIPTTLLAMCDAAIGGKTAVNMQAAKNFIGSFYPSDVTLIDPQVLSTLPMINRKEGIVEMIKHGLIAKAQAFAFLEEHLEKILTLEHSFLDHALKQSIAIKQRVVEEDPLDLGVRAILNFGHTVGHAIEAESRYQVSHGAAVAIGLVAEARLSYEYAGLAKPDVERIDKLIKRLKLPCEYRSGSVDAMLQAMQGDKKNRAGQVHCVLLEAIGKVKQFENLYTHPLSLDQLKKELGA